MSQITRAQALREINRLRGLLKLPTINDDPKRSVADMTREITRLKAGLSNTTNKNPGSVTPPNPVWPPVTGPTATQATAHASKGKPAPNRANVLREINRLRGLLHLPAVQDDPKKSLAQMQADVVKLQFSVDHPTAGSTKKPPATPNRTNVLREINRLRGILKLAPAVDSSFPSLAAMQREVTKLQYTIAHPNAKPATPSGVGGGDVLGSIGGLLGGGTSAGAVDPTAAGAGDTIAGIPRKTMMIVGVALIGIAAVVAIRKGRK